jgi:hypothetical protein
VEDRPAVGWEVVAAGRAGPQLALLLGRVALEGLHRIALRAVGVLASAPSRPASTGHANTPKSWKKQPTLSWVMVVMERPLTTNTTTTRGGFMSRCICPTAFQRTSAASLAGRSTSSGRRSTTLPINSSCPMKARPPSRLNSRSFGSPRWRICGGYEEAGYRLSPRLEHLHRRERRERRHSQAVVWADDRRLRGLRAREATGG